MLRGDNFLKDFRNKGEVKISRRSLKRERLIHENPAPREVATKTTPCPTKSHRASSRYVVASTSTFFVAFVSHTSYINRGSDALLSLNILNRNGKAVKLRSKKQLSGGCFCWLFLCKAGSLLCYIH